MQIKRGLNIMILSFDHYPLIFYAIPYYKIKSFARLMDVDSPKYGGAMLRYRTLPLLKDNMYSANFGWAYRVFIISVLIQDLF